ncbi:MAG: M23 family metallopeptidase [Mangrovibacterium sp.]
MYLLILSFLFFSPQFTYANYEVSNEDKNYFSSPLNIPLFLSGNFGELRNNHFHSGIDFKTQGKQGLPVYAPADGTVSRIKISPYGYGIALYIDHPNGYTTVYGHLSKYNHAIETYARDIQYQEESFTIDVPIPAGTFNISTGDIIAFTGNTGGSGGPHLHFEIRNTASEHPINPLLFNFDVKDSTKPIIKGLRVYPLSENATVNGKHSPQTVTLIGENGKYTLAPESKLSTQGKIGLAVYVQDFLDGSRNRCGIFENTLLLNQDTIYVFRMDEFDFSDSKYANSYVDYAYLKKNRIRYQKSFVDMNNQMSNFHSLKNQGVFEMHYNDTSAIHYTINDVYGNHSTLDFTILGEEKTSLTTMIDSSANYLLCRYSNQTKTRNSVAKFKPNTFYKDQYINHHELKRQGNYSPLVCVGNPYIPIHQNYELKINTSNLPTEWHNRVGVSLLDEQFEAQRFIRGKYENGQVTVSLNELGTFAVDIDSIKPEIRALSIDNHQSLNNSKQINFKVLDKQSGISSWRGELNGEWVLFEYEYKQDKLFYVFDKKRLEMNKTHHLKLDVCDKAGNIATYEASFYK